MQSLNQIEDSYIFFTNKNVEVFHKIDLEGIQDQICSELSQDPFNVKWLNIQSQISYKYHNNYRQAMQIIKCILEKDPINIDARLDLVQILIEYFSEKETEILELINECFALDESYWRTHYECGIYYDKQNQEKVARTIIQKGLELNPNNIWLLSYLGQIYSDKPSLKKEALYCLNKIQEQKYLDFDLMKNIAYINGGLQKSIEQQLYLEKSLQLNPKSISALNNYALVLEDLDKKNLPKCIELWSKTIEINPKSNNTYLNLGLAYENLQQYETSIFYYKKAIESKKLESPYWKICRMLNRKGDYNKTQYYSQKAIKNFPHEEFFYFLNIFYTQRNQNETLSLDFETYEYNIYKSLNLGINSLNQYQVVKLRSAFSLIFQQ